MEDTTYNGWKNYETWNVAQWLTNDQCLYGAMTQFALYSIPYRSLRNELEHSVFNFTRTPDGVDLKDPRLDILALDMVVFRSVDWHKAPHKGSKVRSLIKDNFKEKWQRK